MTSAKTILAFDFGTKRIGVAVGNTLLRVARPLSIIHATNDEQRFLQINALFKEWQPACCVVGLPLHADGTEHTMTARSQRFARQIEGRFSLPTILVDERYSSVVVDANASDHDAQSAALILQQYFDQS